MTLRHQGRSTRTLLAAALIVLLPVVGSTDPGLAPMPDSSLSSFSVKDEVTILITDSGLGGLSVTAELAHSLSSCHPFRSVRLIFANALPSTDHTYNAMPTIEAKATAFSSALDGFTQRYHPDLILIACNTLSVVYPATDFARRAPMPVLGIVETGADLIAHELAERKGSSAVIMGTPTTIGSGVYGDRLAALGAPLDQVTSQACELLESEIQSDPTSAVVAAMIEMYALEALETSQPNDSGELIVALCCTHYGYVRGAFEETFRSLSGRTVTIIDPNAALAREVMAAAPCNRFDATVTHVEVVSKASLGTDEIEAIARILAVRSEATAAALRGFHLDPSLFNY